MTEAEMFDNRGYVVVRNFIDEQTINTVSKYFENKLRRGDWVQGVECKNDSITKLFCYADPLIEVLLNECMPLVAQTCGKDIEPTYSYSRIYQSGEQLKPHIDRPSCEISVTVSVVNQGEKSGIWMHYENNPPVEVILNPGDAVIYKGIESRHWRYPLKDDQLVVQFMLHYVDKNGRYAKFAKDMRPETGYSSDTRNNGEIKCQQEPQK